MAEYIKNDLIDAYARHLFDTFGVDCGLWHEGSDLDLNFEDFDACINNTPKDQLTPEYYRDTIDDFVSEYAAVNDFEHELDIMYNSYAYDSEVVEFIQWYFSDESTDVFTSEDAHRFYDIAKECYEMKEADENIDDFQEFQKRIKEIVV